MSPRPERVKNTAAIKHNIIYFFIKNIISVYVRKLWKTKKELKQKENIIFNLVSRQGFNK